MSETVKFSEEDIDGLRTMGLSEEDIQKLLNLSAEDFLSLAPKKEKKSSQPKPKVAEPKLKTRKGDYHISYSISCQVCGSVEHKHFTIDCVKEYRGLHGFYKTGKGTVKVDGCKSCENWLKGQTKETLIQIILNQKCVKSAFPKITNEKEFPYYPIVRFEDHPCMFEEQEYEDYVRAKNYKERTPQTEAEKDYPLMVIDNSTNVHTMNVTIIESKES